VAGVKRNIRGRRGVGFGLEGREVVIFRVAVFSKSISNLLFSPFWLQTLTHCLTYILPRSYIHTHTDTIRKKLHLIRECIWSPFVMAL
jgi:hypothetical protein